MKAYVKNVPFIAEKFAIVSPFMGFRAIRILLNRSFWVPAVRANTEGDIRARTAAPSQREDILPVSFKTSGIFLSNQT